MLSGVKTLLDRGSSAQVTALAIAIVAVIGVVDHLTGYELSLSFFYLGPVAIVAWYAGKEFAYFICVLSATVCMVVDYTAGHTYSSPLISFWNAWIRLAFFLTTAYLLDTLKTHLRREESLARTDALTRILNTRAFADATSSLLRLAARHRRSTALGYIDLDDFKAVNDNAGHSEGDKVLQAVAAVLTRCVRTSDVVGRLGGDEFAVFMSEASAAEAQVAFARIHEMLRKEMADRGWRVGFSIGVVTCTRAPCTVDEAIRWADHLMYRAKEAGKNQVICEEPAVIGSHAEASNGPNAIASRD